MKKNKLEIYRQGDVLIEAVAKLPANVTRQKADNGRIILAHGEATGHHHSVDIDAADWWKTEGGEQFLTVKTQTAVEHQEHAPIALPPGNYRVRRQREYTPEAIRNVAD
jgi:hypothetical protein